MQTVSFALFNLCTFITSQVLQSISMAYSSTLVWCRKRSYSMQLYSCTYRNLRSERQLCALIQSGALSSVFHLGNLHKHSSTPIHYFHAVVSYRNYASVNSSSVLPGQAPGFSILWKQKQKGKCLMTGTKKLCKCPGGIIKKKENDSNPDSFKNYLKANKVNRERFSLSSLLLID